MLTILLLEVALDSNELAHAIVDVMDNKKASNVMLLDMRDVTLLADYYILCDGSSRRQINAIADELIEELKKAGSQPAKVEGTPDSGWMLIDFGSVVVHIFSPEQRNYYQLEELWQEAPIVVRML
ncbi:MAG: ribosome silencing factor [Anaerolineae bacterium]|nr:ribosome silencing factor [Anaerolineae bacterium]